MALAQLAQAGLDLGRHLVGQRRGRCKRSVRASRPPIRVWRWPRDAQAVDQSWTTLERAELYFTAE